MPRKGNDRYNTTVAGMSTSTLQTLRSLCLQALTDVSQELESAQARLEDAKARLIVAEAKAPRVVPEATQLHDETKPVKRRR